MEETDRTKADAPPPHVQLIEMGLGYWKSRTVYAAARLGLADHLAAGAKSAAELSGATGTHAPSLHRLMRALAGLGVLTERGEGRFALTPLGETLKSGAPGAARATLIALAGQWAWRSWEEVMYSLETGATGFDKVFGMPVFEYLAGHPEEASRFSEAMVGVHGAEPPAVAEAYDFSGIGTLVDVGGATGNLLATILARNPRLRGLLFDRPYVVKEAAAVFQARGVADRVSIEGGDFFETVPTGGDAYILSHIIHDWTEDLCLTILGHCRRAMKPDGRLLLVEMVVPAGDTPHWSKMLDLMMLVVPGGQERTEPEYGALLAKAGFRLTRVVPTESAASVVEGVPA